MDAGELTGCVEDALGRPIGNQRLELLLELAKIYEDEGVLVDGEALPLWRDCPCATPCWKGFPESWQPGRDPTDPWNGGMFLPWVGAKYAPGGVVVLGINLNNASGLAVEYEIAFTQLERLENGHRKPHGSWWAYRSMRAAAAVVRSISGEQILDVEDSVELAGVIDRTARVQAVKCSSKDGARSDRTPEMDSNCPPRYLRRELAVLRPAALVSFGLPTWSAIERIGEIDESVGGEDFSRSVVHVGDLTFDMVWLHHPASVEPSWQRSFQLLLENLQAHPLSPSRRA